MHTYLLRARTVTEPQHSPASNRWKFPISYELPYYVRQKHKIQTLGMSEKDMDTPTWCHGCPPHVIRTSKPMIRICLDDTRSDVRAKELKYRVSSSYVAIQYLSLTSTTIHFKFKGAVWTMQIPVRRQDLLPLVYRRIRISLIILRESLNTVATLELLRKREKVSSLV
jgi:hypothetical protein